MGGRAQVDRQPISTSYLRCLLTAAEIIQLLDIDAAATGEASGPPARRIFRIWPDFILRPQLERSAGTIKGDAAARTYQAGRAGVVWEVIDSGIRR